MTAELRDEESSGEFERPKKGLVHVGSADGGDVLFQEAVTKPLAIGLGDDYGNAHIPFEGLVTSSGDMLHPYTMFPEMPELYEFGSTLQEAYAPHEDVIGMFTAQHASDLEFLEIIKMLESIDPHQYIERTKILTNGKGWQDTRTYSDLLAELLTEQELALWVRLEWRRRQTTKASQIIVAKLVKFNVDRDHNRMMPVVENHDNTLRVTLSQDLELGDPWLYVGPDFYNP